MLRTLRLFFLGPTSSSLKRIGLLHRIKPETLSPMDEKAIAKALTSTVRLRFLGFVAAVTAGYWTPAIEILGPAAVPKIIVGVTVYRCVAILTWNNVEKKLNPFIDSYQLESRPELLMSEEEMKLMWKTMRDAEKAGRKPATAEKKESK